HNVLRLPFAPNEVPVLFVLCIVSVRLREGSFSAIGLARPKSWLATVLIAVVTAVFVIVVGQFITEPLAKLLHLRTNEGAAANALGAMRGDTATALKGLGIVWTFAAFGEELGYRRYLLGRAADIGGRTNLAYWLGLLVVSGLFGLGHYYQGPAGVF